MFMAKHRIEDAYYNTSIFVPHQKLLKFANTNAILKLISLPDWYNNPKCCKEKKMLFACCSDDVKRRNMSRTHVLFSVQMHQLCGCMQKLVLIKQIHVLNSHCQPTLMASIKENKNFPSN